MVNMAKVCEENRGLVYSMARRYLTACGQDRAVDLEDLAQSGYIGLIEAAQTYDETKGMFSTWASVYIRKEIQDTLGLHRYGSQSDRNALSLDAEIGEDITLSDTLEAPDDTERDTACSELIQVVRDTVEALPSPQNDLVRLHDLQGRNLSAAGRMCGLTPAAATRAYESARANLYRDAGLRSLAEAHHLDQRTNWHRHVGMRLYQSTWMSSTEALAFWREEQRRRMAERCACVPCGSIAGAEDGAEGNYTDGADLSAGLPGAKNSTSI